MTFGRLLILAFFVPGLISIAQEKDPAGKTVPSEPPVSGSQVPAPAVPGQVTPAVNPGKVDDSYIIGPSDMINVSVWKEGMLSGGLLVRPDGMVTMPLLGDIQASGFTCPQLADQIQTKLKKFMQDPKVSVVLGSIHSKVIYLLGEVGKRGTIEMTPDMTLLQAIADAGGITEYANAKKMYILRDEGGTHQKIALHYKQALKGDSQFDLPLKPGDTIVVP